jgi:membrane protease YdiL (CAAX protease family)
MRTETRALLHFLSIACIPPWIGWSLLKFGAVPANGAWQALYLTGWSASAAGLIATHMQEGGRGVRRLLLQAVRVAVPIRWWLVVVLVPPLAVAGSALVYAAFSGVSIGFSSAGYLRLMAPAMWVTFFLGPFGEEFGWRGYLLPSLARRFSVLRSVLIVGAVWAIWHWPLLYQGFFASPGRELVVVLVGITYMSIWIGTVYLRTESLLLAMLMHWNINAARDISADVFLGLPAGTDGLLQWSGVVANALVAILAIPALLAIRAR